MINPNKRYEVKGKIVAVEKFTSMTVFKVETKQGLLDYTVFGSFDTGLAVDDRINATVAYSITLNGYFIKNINSSLKAA